MEPALTAAGPLLLLASACLFTSPGRGKVEGERHRVARVAATEAERKHVSCGRWLI